MTSILIILWRYLRWLISAIAIAYSVAAAIMFWQLVAGAQPNTVAISASLPPMPLVASSNSGPVITKTKRVVPAKTFIVADFPACSNYTTASFQESHDFTNWTTIWTQPYPGNGATNVAVPVFPQSNTFYRAVSQ